MSLIRNPKFPSSTSAVATRSLGRQPQKPSRMVVMISLYCSVVSAAVFLFILSSKFVFRGGKVRTLSGYRTFPPVCFLLVFVFLDLYELCNNHKLLAAINTSNVDISRGSDAQSAAWASVLASAAFLPRSVSGRG